MKTGILIALCFLIIAAIDLSWTGKATGFTQSQPVPLATKPLPVKNRAPKAHPDSQPVARSRNKPHACLLPDLAVEKIWLDHDCIVFRMKNSGPGMVPPDLRARAQVRLSWGGKRRVFALKKVDPHARLTKPGNTIRFATKICLQNPQHVRVELLDGTRRQAEKNTANNVMSRHLSPKNTPASGQQTPGSRLKKARTASEFSGGHLRSSLHALPSMPVAIEKIFLHQGTVHVRLKNTAKSTLSTRQFQPSTLRLFIDSKAHTWHLANIDRKGVLRHPRGRVDFDTGIRIASATNINARLSDGQGHGVRVAQALKPPIQAGQVAVTKAQSENLSLRKTIRILYPNGGEKWQRGKSYTVRWQSSGNIGNVRIKLNWGSTGGGSHTVVNTTSDTGRYSFRVPETGISQTEQQSRQYKIVVMSRDGSVKDESNNFFSIQYPEPPGADFDLSGEIRNIKIQEGGGLGGIFVDDMLVFDIWIMNKGERFFQMVPLVYRLIDTQTNLVILQREVGFSNVYPDRYYSAKIGIEPMYTNNHSFSHMLIEVEVDPQNTLHEKEKHRRNNTDRKAVK